MPFVYDNLIATLISMTVFLILTSIQMEATRINTARTSRNVAMTQAQQFATWLEEDLAEMGKNMEAGEVTFQNPQDSTQWHTTQFTFRHDSLKPGGGTVQVRTRYELEKAGSRMVDGTKEMLYEVRRSQKVGGGGWQSKGQSPSSLGFFEINMLNKNATPVANPKANRGTVEFIRVRFSVIAPFQSEETLLRRVRRSLVVPYRLAQ